MNLSKKKLFNKSLLLIVCSVFIFAFIGIVSNSKFYGKVDFIQYYSASHLIRKNINPYKKENIEAFQNKIANKYKYIYMYNPPQVFTIIYGLSFFDYEVSAKIWRFCSIFLIVLSCALLFSIFNYNDRFSYYFLFLFLAIYEPIFSILYYGQISFVLLFAITLSIFFLREGKKKNNLNYMYLSGACLGLISIKPHILILLIPLYLLFISKHDFLKITVGLLVSILLLLLSSEMIFPGINLNYLIFIKEPPIFWKNPTIGSWVQRFLDIHSVYIRLAPTVVALIAMLFFILHKEVTKKEVYSIDSIVAFYPLCLLACPYFWIFDYVMLLPAIFYLVKVLEGFKSCNQITIFIFLLALSFFSFFRDSSLGQEYYIYFPLIIFTITFCCNYFGDNTNNSKCKIL